MGALPPRFVHPMPSMQLLQNLSAASASLPSQPAQSAGQPAMASPLLGAGQMTRTIAPSSAAPAASTKAAARPQRRDASDSVCVKKPASPGTGTPRAPPFMSVPENTDSILLPTELTLERVRGAQPRSPHF